MTRAGSIVVLALAAAAAGCMGTRHASRGAAAPPPQAAATPAETGSAAAAQGMGMMDQCPMAVPGTQVAAADTADGESVTFTTTSPEAVADLRSRVRAMADMHNRHHAGGQAGMQGGAEASPDEGAGPAGTGEDRGSAGSGQGSDEAAGNDTASGSAGSSGTAGDQGAGPGMHERMMSHPSHAVVDDVDGGARVTVTPDDPADLDRLRSAVRAHAERMSDSGSCGMDRMGHEDMPQQEQPAPRQ